MALAVSSTIPAVTSCDICRGVKPWRSFIRARRGYCNALTRTMKNNNLISKIAKSWYRSKHKFAENLLGGLDKYDARNISGRSKLLNKVSMLMGYDGSHDFIENEKSEKRYDENIKDVSDDFDASWASLKFPSITLGSSPPVDLYDETISCSEGKNVLVDMEWIGPSALSEQLHSADVLPNMNTSTSLEMNNGIPGEEITLPLKELKEYPHIPPLCSPETWKTEDKFAHAEETSIKSRLESQQIISSLDSSINCIPGLSTRLRHQLENCGFHTVRKLLQHFPRTYADLRNAQVGVEDGQYMISVGKILSSRGVKASYSFSFLEVVVGCEILNTESQHAVGHIDSRAKKTIYLHLKKFFRGARFTYRPFLKSLEAKHELGAIVCVSGKVRSMQAKDHFEMREYNIDVLKDDKESSVHAEGRPYPIYPSKGGLNPDLLRNTISRSIQGLIADIDPIPNEISEDFGLFNLHDAYSGIHQPKSVEEADLARKRLIFDEFFYLQLGRLFQMLEGLGTTVQKDILLEKYKTPNTTAVHMELWSNLANKFLKALPYSLTPSQLAAVSEIIWDLKRPVPMNRLLQGDVGCGKTVVAFLACMEVIGAGHQAAFMVPTELLAIQHYEHILDLLGNMEDDQSKPSVALLTGSTSTKLSRMIRKDLQSGGISLVIGTHSLISEALEFASLRIAVVDEQHRFGVIQRGRFNSKLYNSSLSSRMAAANIDRSSSESEVHMAPHILAMSATPIPRTLALALYGDMSLTQITDLPPGRIPVETYVIEGTYDGLEEVYKMILDELQMEGKVYIVYPVIEQSEQLPQLRAASAELEAISHRFQGHNCGLLHGRMKGDEKDEALRRFRSGETKILLSTQVIEIGVDVPDASMMVVMNAERFGIAQLHQLRGRVGRGTRKSKCLLVASTSSSLGRLKVLEKSSDGFYLANMDLLLRGPGDLLGKKQSGHLPEFPVARLEVDGNILQDAHAAALRILTGSHDLERFPELKAELSMRQPLCLLGD